MSLMCEWVILPVTGSSIWYIFAECEELSSQFCEYYMGNMTSSHSADDPEPMDIKEAEVSYLVLVVNLIWDYY